MLSVKEKIEIANTLRGSCMSPNSLADTYELDIFDGDLEISEAANEYGVWLCEQCNWWCDEEEMHGEICEQCDGENNE